MAVGSDSRIGSVLAGYRLEEVLGRGGMGVVFRAHDDALDRSVAVKLIAPELASDNAFRDRFLVEARLAASIDHPNVVPVYDAGAIDGELYLAMRYVEGADLKRLLVEEGPLQPERVLAICGQVAAALDAAHRRGLVHRDVKPSNVLLDEDGHAYLADFGLTRRLSDQAPGFDAGLSLGTPAYVAPEQIESAGGVEAVVGPRADQYSLACLLYECLAGEPPFPRGSEAATLFAHLEEQPPSLPRLESVLGRGLAKDPEDRFETCTALVEAARASLPQTRRRRRRLLAAGVLATLAAAATAAAVVLTGGDEPRVGHDWTRVPHAQSVFGGTVGTSAVDIADGPAGPVAVGATGRYTIDLESDAAVWASPDGVTWTRVAAPSLGGPGRQFLNSVVADASGYTAGGASSPPGDRLEDVLFVGDAVVWRSRDGRSWRRVVLDNFGANAGVLDLSTGPSGVVAVGASQAGLAPSGETFLAGGVVWTSRDGESWRRILPADPGVFARPGFQRENFVWLAGVAASGAGSIVVVGNENSFTAKPNFSVATIWLSTDEGESWVRVPHDDALFGDRTTWAGLADVSAGDAGFVAVGSDELEGDTELPADQALSNDPGPLVMQAVVLTSPDGLNWSRVPDERLPGGGDKVHLEAVNHGAGGYVAAGWRRNQPGVDSGDIDAVVWTSPDGQTWTEATDPAGEFDQPGGQLIVDIAWGGPGLVAVGLDGDKKSSSTAIWTSP